MIHWMASAPAPRSSAIGGIDTVSTMLSTTSTSVLRQSTIRMSQRRGLRAAPLVVISSSASMAIPFPFSRLLRTPFAR